MALGAGLPVLDGIGGGEPAVSIAENDLGRHWTMPDEIGKAKKLGGGEQPVTIHGFIHKPGSSENVDPFEVISGKLGGGEQPVTIQGFIHKPGSSELSSLHERIDIPSAAGLSYQFIPIARMNEMKAESERLQAEIKGLQAENQRLQAISTVRQLQREVSPAYLVRASYEINVRLRVVDESGGQAARQVAEAGRESCEALKSLCTDESFRAALTELDRLGPADYEQALRLIADDRGFENFLDLALQVLKIAGMPERDAEELVRRCSWYLKNRGRFERLGADSYLQHLGQLRDATCSLAEGELRDKVKQLKRRRLIKRISVVMGTASIKYSIIGLASLHGPEAAVLGSACGDVAAQLATALVDEES